MSENLNIEQVDSVQVARIGGRFDAKAVEDMKAELRSIPLNAVALDLAAVTFIDSSALGFVVSIFRRTQEAKGKLALFGLKPQVMAIFELTRLHRTFDIYDTQEQALAALKS